VFCTDSVTSRSLAGDVAPSATTATSWATLTILPIPQPGAPVTDARAARSPPSCGRGVSHILIGDNCSRSESRPPRRTVHANPDSRLVAQVGVQDLRRAGATQFRAAGRAGRPVPADLGAASTRPEPAAVPGPVYRRGPPHRRRVPEHHRAVTSNARVCDAN